MDPPAILCPLDNRRSVQEVYVKTFVFNFTTLAFYFHLHRQRDGGYLSLGSLFFFLAPMNLAFRYVFAVSGILVFTSVRLVIGIFAGDRHRQVTVQQSTRAFRWLFGKAPEPGNASFLGTAVSSSVPENRELLVPAAAAAARSPPPLERLAKFIGKVLVAGGFLAQCCASIYLYQRRKEHDAVTLFDRKMFDLACGGLAVGLMSLCYSLDFPIFKDPAPTGLREPLDYFVLFCRDSYFVQRGFPTPISGKHGGALRLLYTFCALLVSFVVDMLRRDPLVFDAYQSMWTFDNIHILYFFMFLCFMSAISTASKSAPFRTLDAARWETWVSLLASIMAIFCLFTLGLLLFMALFSCTMFVYSFDWVFFYPLAFTEASGLSNAPQDAPCPLLWSDPVAQYLWALA